jgi:signal transduction histidine kinase
VEEELEVALSRLLSISGPQGTQFEVTVKGDEARLTLQQRDELSLILCEGVKNALVHSDAEIIEVDVNITDEHVEATIKDDGRGFEPEEQTRRGRGTGLTSMRERASLLGGNLYVISDRAQGTRIEVFVPLLRSSR